MTGKQFATPLDGLLYWILWRVNQYEFCGGGIRALTELETLLIILRSTAFSENELQKIKNTLDSIMELVRHSEKPDQQLLTDLAYTLNEVKKQ